MIVLYSIAVALSGITAIALGAVAAHASLDTQANLFIQTALDYHLIHAVCMFAGLIAVSLWPIATKSRKRMGIALTFWFVGVLCFCGGLYAQAFFDVDAGKIIPAGGFAFMLGWLSAGWSFIGVSPHDR